MNKVVIWDDHERKNRTEITFNSVVKAVKLRKDMMLELKRTHKTSSFDRVKAGQRKGQEMDRFEEITSNTDTEVQKEVKETDLDRDTD